MAYADWFVPRPSLAAQANLQHAINAVRNEGPTDVSKLIDLTESLLRQNAAPEWQVRSCFFAIA